MPSIKETRPTARKSYVCELCGCPIDEGTRYLRIVDSDSGSIFTCRCHEECSEVAVLLKMPSLCPDGITDEYFREIVRDYIEENNPSALGLSPYAQVLEILKQKQVKQ